MKFSGRIGNYFWIKKAPMDNEILNPECTRHMAFSWSPPTWDLHNWYLAVVLDPVDVKNLMEEVEEENINKGNSMGQDNKSDTVMTRTVGNVEETKDGKFTWWCEFSMEGQGIIKVNSTSKNLIYDTKEEAKQGLTDCGKLILSVLTKALGPENVTKVNNGRLPI